MRTNDSLESRSGCHARKKGNALIIDCSRCNKGRSLEDNYCLQGALECMCDASQVKRLILSWDSELLYPQECVDLVASLAKTISFCRAQHFLEPFQDCCSCSSNPNRLFRRISGDVLSYWENRDRIEPLGVGSHGQACERCSSSTKINLQHLRSMIASLEREVTKEMFHIVPEDKHD